MHLERRSDDIVKIRNFIKRIIYPETYSQEAFVKALREKYHVDIGNHCRIYSPNQTFIDKQRGHMLHIGDYCKISRNVTILAHDYSRSVCCNMTGGYENIGEAAYTFIGNNVFIGVNSTILMGAHVGDNSIVGAGAVVSGHFPEGVVIAGNPARVICTIDEFYQKRKKRQVESAKEYVRRWRIVYGRDPSIDEMTNAFLWLYVPHTIDSFDQYSHLFELSAVDKDRMKISFLNSTPIYSSFDDFLKDCTE